MKNMDLHDFPSCFEMAGKFDDHPPKFRPRIGMGKTTYMQLLAGLYDKKKEAPKPKGDDEEASKPDVDAEPISLRMACHRVAAEY